MDTVVIGKLGELSLASLALVAVVMVMVLSSRQMRSAYQMLGLLVQSMAEQAQATQNDRVRQEQAARDERSRQEVKDALTIETLKVVNKNLSELAGATRQMADEIKSISVSLRDLRDHNQTVENAIAHLAQVTATLNEAMAKQSSAMREDRETWRTTAEQFKDKLTVELQAINQMIKEVKDAQVEFIQARAGGTDAVSADGGDGAGSHTGSAGDGGVGERSGTGNESVLPMGEPNVSNAGANQRGDAGHVDLVGGAGSVEDRAAPA